MATIPSILDHARRTVRSNNTHMTVRSLANDFNDANTGHITTPESQREWAWKGSKGLTTQRDFVDSLMYGYPVPSIVLHKKTDATRGFAVYDGRHRIQTMWEFANDKFGLSVVINGKREVVFFSQMCREDREIFLERDVPVTIVENATLGELADIFIRLQQGSPLKPYDLLWARKHSSLVRATMNLIGNNDRFAKALGLGKFDFNKRDRPRLSHMVGLVTGLSTGHAGNITTSFIRLADMGGLNMDIREDVVEEGLVAICDLLEEANTKHPVNSSTQKCMAKVGFVLAFFVAEWLSATDNDAKSAVHSKWVYIIGKTRGSKDESKAMKAALKTTGAGNLNATKIANTLAQLNKYLESKTVAHLVMDADDDDDESDE